MMDTAKRSSGRLAMGLTLVAALLMLAFPAQAQEAGVLDGTVVNGTAGGPALPAGLAVTLRVFSGDTELDPQQTVSDAQGRFRFEGLDTDPALSYWPEVVYLDLPYTSGDALRFATGQPALSVTLTVYETTEDDSDIRLNAVHFIGESLGQVLRISEVHLFGNVGDRTYIGKPGGAGSSTDHRSTVFVPLPENIVGLAMEDATAESRFVEVAGGVDDTEPVRPGTETSMVRLSYHLVVTGTTATADRQFAYPANLVNVLVVQPGLTLRGQQLQAMEPISFQDQDYEVYQAAALAADTPLHLEFVITGETADASTGASATSASSGASGTATAPQGKQPLLRWFGFSLCALAVIGAGIYLKASKPSKPAARPNVPKNQEVRQLVAELAELEQALEAGDLDQAAYEQQRAAKMDAVKSVWH